MTWSVSCTIVGNCGTVSATGLYTAPASINAADSVTVKATPIADPAAAATGAVTLVPVVAISVSPTAASLIAGGTQQFTATVTGTTNAAVTWSLSCTNTGNCGTIDATGLYTAPATLIASDTVTVTATSVADGMKTATASVTLVDQVSVSMSPASTTLSSGGTQQFTATVTGSSDTSVSWSLSCTNTGNCGAIVCRSLHRARECCYRGYGHGDGNIERRRHEARHGNRQPDADGRGFDLAERHFHESMAAEPRWDGAVHGYSHRHVERIRHLVR